MASSHDVTSPCDLLQGLVPSCVLTFKFYMGQSSLSEWRSLRLIIIALSLNETNRNLLPCEIKICSCQSRGGPPSLFWSKKDEMTERRNASMAKTNPALSLAQGLDLPLICTLRNENLQVFSWKVLVKNLLRTFYSLTIITVKTRFLSVVEFFVDRDQMTACQSCKKMAAISLRLYLPMEVNSHFLEKKFGDPSLFLCCFEMRNKFI